jgi:hypothetical protein
MELIEMLLQFAVAAGTLALAYFTFKSVKASDKQLKFIKKQTELFLSQKQPNLQIKNKSFNSNKLLLTLNNTGNGTAEDIAVSCSFHIVKPLRGSKNWLGKHHLNIPVISEIGTKKWVIDSDEGLPLILNMKMKDKTILIPSTLVIFLENDEFSNSLPQGSTRTFQCEPRFYLKAKKSRFHETPDYDCKAIPFDELRTLLINNKIEEISVYLSLYSKDNLQNVKNHGTVANFVIDLSKDENLESASRRGQRGSYPLDKEEMKQRIKWEDYDWYIHGKYLDPEEND